MAPTKQRVGALDVRALVASVRPSIVGLRVTNVYDFSAGGSRGGTSSSYILKFAGKESKVFLFIHAGFRLYTTEWKKDKGALPSPFCVRLRKGLRGKKLEDIHQHGADRVVILTFGKSENALHLVVELYVSGNIILTDHTNLIQAVLRRHTLSAPAGAAPAEGGREARQETEQRIAVNEYYRLDPPEMSLLRDAIRPIDFSADVVKRQLTAIQEAACGKDTKSKTQVTWAQALGRLAPFVSPALAVHALLATTGDESAKKRVLTQDGLDEAVESLRRAVMECLRMLRAVSSAEDFLGAGPLPAELESQASATPPVEGYIVATRRSASSAEEKSLSFSLLYDYEEFSPVVLRQFADLQVLPSPQDIQREREERAAVAVQRLQVDRNTNSQKEADEKEEEEEQGEKGEKEKKGEKDNDEGGDDEVGNAETRATGDVESAVAAVHANVAPGTRVLLHFRDINMCVDEYFSSVDVQKSERAEAQARQEALSRVEKIKSDQEQRMQLLEEEAANLLQQAQAVEANVVLVEQIIQLLRAALATGVDWDELGRQMKLQAKEGHPLAVHVHELKLEKQRAMLLLEAPRREEAEEPGEASETILVPVDVALSAHGNAQLLHSQVKQLKAKTQKTSAATAAALAAADRKAQRTLKQKDQQVLQAQQQLQKVRKAFWFEKFHWFISSDHYLVLAGRDAQQNEILFRRYLRSNDVYVHADVHGAATCIIKNSRETEPGKCDDPPVPLTTLQQCGEFAVCRSSAWTTKSPSAAWWVYGRQVSKSAPSGLYLSTGSFMIRGRRNFIQVHRLEMGFGLLFRLADEASVARHVAARTRLALEEAGSEGPQGSPPSSSSSSSAVLAEGESGAEGSRRGVKASVGGEDESEEEKSVKFGFLEAAQSACGATQVELSERRRQKHTEFLRDTAIEHRAATEAPQEVVESRRASGAEATGASDDGDPVLAQLEKQEERQRQLQEQLNQVKSQLEEQLRMATRSPSVGTQHALRGGRLSRCSVEFSPATLQDEANQAGRDSSVGQRIRRRHPTGHLSVQDIAELRGAAAAAEVVEVQEFVRGEQSRLEEEARSRRAAASDRVSRAPSDCPSSSCFGGDMAEELRPLQQELLQRQYSAETHQLLMAEKLREVALQRGTEEMMARAESARSRRPSKLGKSEGDDCHVTFSPDPPKVAEKTISALHVDFDGLPPEVIPRRAEPASLLLVQIEEELREARGEEDATGDEDRVPWALRRRATGWAAWQPPEAEEEGTQAESDGDTCSRFRADEEIGGGTRGASRRLSPPAHGGDRAPSVLVGGEEAKTELASSSSSGSAEKGQTQSPSGGAPGGERDFLAVEDLSRTGADKAAGGKRGAGKLENARRSPSVCSERSATSTHSLTPAGSRISRRMSVDEGPPPDGFTEETLPTPRELLSHSSIDFQHSGGDEAEESVDDQEIHIIVRRLSIKEEKELFRCRSADHGPTPKGFCSGDVPSAKDLLTLQQYLSDKLGSPARSEEDDGTTSAGTRRSRRAVSEGSASACFERGLSGRVGRSKEDFFLDVCARELASAGEGGETERNRRKEPEEEEGEEEETEESAEELQKAASSGEEEDTTEDEEDTDDAVKEETINAEIPSRKRMSAAERRRQKKGNREAKDDPAGTAEEKEDMGGKEKAKGPRLQPVPRGKRGKLAKMKKKYGDQDEEEKQFKMSLIGAEEIKRGGPTATANAAAPACAAKKLPGRKAAQQREERRELKEVLEEEGDERLTEQCSQIDLLTASPLPEDALLCVVPVTAPYSAMSKYKFKAKLVPGSMKKGNAGQAALRHFLQQADDDRQKQLIKSITLAEVALSMISDVRLSVPGIQKQLTAARRQKKEQKKKTVTAEE
ncbi:signal peptidase [Toxoplasma gondii RUB]|uniref:Signal peptidase n=1 Tax=Toxoplasma gondii RUB TaxID=935652 RepID=A0A086M0A1_TOXGO|nr:signal peptidase [Toxoplasma gondii RUB]